MKLIGFGGWVSYYYFLIGSTITKLLKEDIFGFGKSFQILNDLIISAHKFLIIFISYFSEFFFGLIICLYLIISERMHIKKRNKYEKMKNEITTNINGHKTSIKKNKKNEIPNQEVELTTKENDIEKDCDEINQNLINDNNIFRNKLSEKLKSNEGNQSKLEEMNDTYMTQTSQAIPKKFEYIHNDLNDYNIDASMCSIILSSFLLIVYYVVIKWIFSRNEIFDYYFINILIMTLIFKYHYKQNIYSHQTLALFIILIIAGALFIACLFEDIDLSGKNKTIWEAFDENHYMVFIFIIIYFIASMCSCYGIIIQKKIMDYQYVSPYKIIFYKGLLGMLISFILIIISTFIPCKPYHISNFKEKNTSIINNINIYSDSNSSSINNYTAPPLFECVDSYGNNTYFDNFFSYFSTIKNLNSTIDKNLELFLSIPVYCILHFLTSILLIFVNKLLSPFHCLIVDSLYRLLHLPIQALQKIQIKENSEGFFYEFIIQPLSTRILRVFAHFVSIIGYCIYLEIIELKFCKLNNNIRKNIKKRANSDGKVREYLSSNSISSNSYISNDSEEEETESIKNK